MEQAKGLKLLLCFSGIMAFLLVYGLTQEKIMTTSYADTNDDDSGRFKDTALLVLINRLVSILVACTSMVFVRREPLIPSAPLSFYFYISISNFLSTFCQYEALKFVTFPIQTLGKCAKMIPVLVIGTVTGRKQYKWRDYATGMLIMLGCFIFLTTGEISSSKRSSGTTSVIGLLLILAYLAFDGMTSTTQERLFKNYNTSTNNQMLFVNLSSALLSFTTLLIPWHWLTGDNNASVRLLPAIEFLFAHPRLLFDAILLSICSAGGQMVIYYTIKEFGALIYSTIMTTRQFFSILLSAIIFLHPITAYQWLGASLVFGSLYWSAVTKEHSKLQQKKRSSDPDLPTSLKQ